MALQYSSNDVDVMTRLVHNKAQLRQILLHFYLKYPTYYSFNQTNVLYNIKNVYLNVIE